MTPSVGPGVSGTSVFPRDRGLANFRSTGGPSYTSLPTGKIYHSVGVGPVRVPRSSVLGALRIWTPKRPGLGLNDLVLKIPLRALRRDKLFEGFTWNTYLQTLTNHEGRSRKESTRCSEYTFETKDTSVPRERRGQKVS